MGNVLKGYRYRIVDNRSFELPLPVKYVLLKEEDEIAEYEVSAEEEIKCRIITKYKENMITPIYRPLTIADIYYFFSCRVFQDKTPFTSMELSLLGLERYNVYDIIRKTRGITPYDNYWLRFDGDNCSYDKAKAEWDEIMSKMGVPGANSTAAAAPSEENVAKSDANINEILNQHKVDVASKFSEEANAQASAPAAEPASALSASNTMSEAEIEALLMRSGISAFDEPDEPKSSGGTMNQEDIEKMLAASASAVEAVPAEAPAPAEEAKPESSGGKMSQDDIEKMLAAASAVEAAPAEAPAPAEEPKPESSGGKMSRDDIEKMLAAASEAVQEPLISKPEQPALDTEAEEFQPTLENMSPETSETEAKSASSSGGKMSQADIEALLNGMAEDAK